MTPVVEQARAKVNLAKAQVQTLAEKVQQYAQDTGGLPGSLDELVKSSATGWLGPYAKDSELKDPWNHPYTYAVPGNGQAFDLVSLGADGQAGGTDGGDEGRRGNSDHGRHADQQHAMPGLTGA